ncbi:MAG: hypothetical protein H7X94_10450 [Vallitaleaceae bacterium]|nr:hypothetical protein [Vallitaleaceae bacterium]
MSKNKISFVIEVALIVILLGAVCGSALYVKGLVVETSDQETVTVANNTKLVLYEGPKSLKDATEEDLISTSENQRDISLMHCTDTQITVNGYDCYVYDTNVNHTRKWVEGYMPPLARTPIAYFDFEGSANIQITVPNQDLAKVKISPISYGIVPVIDPVNHTISFTVEKPDTYTITIGDTDARAIHIFANPLEVDVPSPDDEGIVYVGPGEWDIESIILEDGQTLYIAGGAVIHGIVNANFAKNITVRGRGIIDGSKLTGWQGKSAFIPLKFDHCDNITIKDVIVLNANAWVCQALDSKNGVIDGIKIISARPNGDGITLQSCVNYDVKNCFIRSWDDNLVVKNYEGNSDQISFSNMQLWTDLAQSMEIGYETNKGMRENATITNISFQNITVLNNYHKPVISVHNADDATISEVLFKDIVIENAQMGSGDGSEMPFLIDLNIAQSTSWSKTKERGQIRNVTIENVQVLAGKNSPSRIIGFDETHTIENVSIKNLEILGVKITDFEKGQFEIDEVSTHDLTIE